MTFKFILIKKNNVTEINAFTEPSYKNLKVT